MDKLFEVLDDVVKLAAAVAPHLAEKMKTDIAELRGNPSLILEWIKHHGNIPGTPGHRPIND